jgi:hypothetical protein
MGIFSNRVRLSTCRLAEHLPHKEFQKCVARYHGDSNLRGFSCRDQHLAMSFAQLSCVKMVRPVFMHHCFAAAVQAENEI